MKKQSLDTELPDEEIARRYEATLKSVLSTPPQHRTAKGEKANPPKKRGRPKKPSGVRATKLQEM